jgi:hypothetical protein
LGGGGRTERGAKVCLSFCLSCAPSFPNSSFREDLIAVLEDVGEYGLVHSNVNVFNLLCFRGADTPEARCPRHNVVHGWRVIDFDRSLMVDMKNASEGGKEATEWVTWRIGYPAVFWGNQLY